MASPGTPIAPAGSPRRGDDGAAVHATPEPPLASAGNPCSASPPSRRDSFRTAELDTLFEFYDNDPVQVSVALVEQLIGGHYAPDGACCYRDPRVLFSLLHPAFLARLPGPLQAELLDTLGATLRTAANAEAGRQAGLLRWLLAFLDYLAQAGPDARPLAGKIAQLLSALLAHRAAPGDVRAVLAAFTGAGGRRSGAAGGRWLPMLLLDVLRGSIAADLVSAQPRAYFSLDGGSAALAAASSGGVSLPTSGPPGSLGGCGLALESFGFPPAAYSVLLWFRPEALPAQGAGVSLYWIGASVPQPTPAQPPIAPAAGSAGGRGAAYSAALASAMAAAAGLPGLSASLEENCLVLRALGTPAECVRVPLATAPLQHGWHCLIVTHAKRTLLAAKLDVYLGGRKLHSGTLRYPRMETAASAAGSIGGRSPAGAALQGQLGPVALFSVAVTPEEAEALTRTTAGAYAALGAPGVEWAGRTVRGSAAAAATVGSSAGGRMPPRLVGMRGDPASKLIFSLDARHCEGAHGEGACYSPSLPSAGGAAPRSGPRARLLRPGTTAVQSSTLAQAVACLGGPPALLPLLLQPEHVVGASSRERAVLPNAAALADPRPDGRPEASAPEAADAGACTSRGASLGPDEFAAAVSALAALLPGPLAHNCTLFLRRGGPSVLAALLRHGPAGHLTPALLAAINQLMGALASAGPAARGSLADAADALLDLRIWRRAPALPTQAQHLQLLLALRPPLRTLLRELPAYHAATDRAGRPAELSLEAEAAMMDPAAAANLDATAAAASSSAASARLADRLLEIIEALAAAEPSAGARQMLHWLRDHAGPAPASVKAARALLGLLTSLAGRAARDPSVRPLLLALHDSSPATGATGEGIAAVGVNVASGAAGLGSPLVAVCYSLLAADTAVELRLDALRLLPLAWATQAWAAAALAAHTTPAAAAAAAAAAAVGGVASAAAVLMEPPMAPIAGPGTGALLAEFLRRCSAGPDEYVAALDAMQCASSASGGEGSVRRVARLSPEAAPALLPFLDGVRSAPPTCLLPLLRALNTLLEADPANKALLGAQRGWPATLLALGAAPAPEPNFAAELPVAAQALRATMLDVGAAPAARTAAVDELASIGTPVATAALLAALRRPGVPGAVRGACLGALVRTGAATADLVHEAAVEAAAAVLGAKLAGAAGGTADKMDRSSMEGAALGPALGGCPAVEEVRAAWAAATADTTAGPAFAAATRTLQLMALRSLTRARAALRAQAPVDRRRTPALARGVAALAALAGDSLRGDWCWLPVAGGVRAVAEEDAAPAVDSVGAALQGLALDNPQAPGLHADLRALALAAWADAAPELKAGGYAASGPVGGSSLLFLLPAWLPDEAAAACLGCGAGWPDANMLRSARHHCRFCGGVFCEACSAHRAVLPDAGAGDGASSGGGSGPTGTNVGPSGGFLGNSTSLSSGAASATAAAAAATAAAAAKPQRVCRACAADLRMLAQPGTLTAELSALPQAVAVEAVVTALAELGAAATVPGGPEAAASRLADRAAAVAGLLEMLGLLPPAGIESEVDQGGAASGSMDDEPGVPRALLRWALSRLVRAAADPAGFGAMSAEARAPLTALMARMARAVDAVAAARVAGSDDPRAWAMWAAGPALAGAGTTLERAGAVARLLRGAHGRRAAAEARDALRRAAALKAANHTKEQATAAASAAALGGELWAAELAWGDPEPPGSSAHLLHALLDLGSDRGPWAVPVESLPDGQRFWQLDPWLHPRLRVRCRLRRDAFGTRRPEGALHIGREDEDDEGPPIESAGAMRVGGKSHRGAGALHRLVRPAKGSAAAEGVMEDEAEEDEEEEELNPVGTPGEGAPHPGGDSEGEEEGAGLEDATELQDATGGLASPGSGSGPVPVVALVGTAAAGEGSAIGSGPAKRLTLVQRMERAAMVVEAAAARMEKAALGAVEAVRATVGGSGAAGSAFGGAARARSAVPLRSEAAELIVPMRVLPGRLVLTASHLIFHCTRLEGPSAGSTLRDGRLLKSYRWPLDRLRELYVRRYLLRRSALELLTAEGRAYFVNLPAGDRDPSAAGGPPLVDALYRAILAQSPRLLAASPIFRGPVPLPPPRLLRRADWTEAWRRRELSNFEYLMLLNSAAGRTYNNLTQYPVMPWVLADYVSAELDLSDPSRFRDLSRPIGALEPKRLAALLSRYEAFDDPSIPKFHYGSHYSSLGTVLFFLLRLEPFSGHALSLQGGRFDHADRLFHSVAEAWAHVLASASDVKELVPELYCLPDCLRNSAGLPLGTRQDGAPLGDVILPPWAKGSPEEFIRLHRAALESEYVSAHLHAWIDLIFGCKQRGRAAVEAHNVFYYLTYEGAVDLGAIEDELERRATEAQIANFGQTPSQLFVRPHPPRDVREDAGGSAHNPPRPSGRPVAADAARSGLLPRMSYGVGVDPAVAASAAGGSIVVPAGPWGPLPSSSASLSSSAADDSSGLIAALLLDRGWDALHVVLRDGSVLSRKWPGGACGPGGGSGASSAGAPELPSGPTLDERRRYGGPLVLDAAGLSGALRAAAGGPRVPPAQRLALLPGGGPAPGMLLTSHWDGAVLALALGEQSGSTPVVSQALCYHRRGVVCMAVAEDGTALVLGAADGTLTLWATRRTGGRRGRGAGAAAGASPDGGFASPEADALATPPASASAPRASWLGGGSPGVGEPLDARAGPAAVLVGHAGAVVCAAICSSLGLVASGAADGAAVLLHTTSGRLMRVIDLPPGPGAALAGDAAALGAATPPQARAAGAPTPAHSPTGVSPPASLTLLVALSSEGRVAVHRARGATESWLGVYSLNGPLLASCRLTEPLLGLLSVPARVDEPPTGLWLTIGPSEAAIRRVGPPGDLRPMARLERPAGAGAFCAAAVTVDGRSLLLATADGRVHAYECGRWP